MKKFVLALALTMLPALASASTIIQFTEAGGFNSPFHFVNNGSGTTTVSASKTVNVVFDPAFCLVVGCGGATNGVYNLTFGAVSFGPATCAGPCTAGSAVTQAFSGNLSLTQGAFNLLTVNFTDLFQGSIGGSSPTLQASQPPDLFSGSSNVLDPLKLGIPRGFALSFSSFSGGGVGLTGTSLRTANGDASGTISATAVEPVPEPASMLLFGTGAVALATRLRRRKV